MFNHCTKQTINYINEDIYYSEKKKKYQFSKYMCNIFRIAKCRQSYTAYCIRRIFRGRVELRHTMFMSGHRKERSISIFTRKCTGNKQSQSLKHLSTCHQRAMAVQESAVFRTTIAHTCFSNQCLKTKYTKVSSKYFLFLF